MGGALWEAPCRRSRRVANGVCLTHLGPGRLLSSQVNLLPSKAPIQVTWVLGA